MQHDVSAQAVFVRKQAATIGARKRLFVTVGQNVRLQITPASERSTASVALERLLVCVNHPVRFQVTLQRERSLAKGTLERFFLFVGHDVSSQATLVQKSTRAVRARKRFVIVAHYVLHDNVLLQQTFVGEQSMAIGTGSRSVGKTVRIELQSTRSRDSTGAS